MSCRRIKARKGNNSTVYAVMACMLLAVLVKSVFPAGFMPTVDKNGFTEIVICSGMGERTISVPNENAPTDHHEDKTSSGICSFATLASAIDLPVVTFATVLADTGNISTPKLTTELAPDVHFDQPYPPRGPPAVNQI